MNGVRVTHIGGPTVLIEVGGWRLLTDRTFDPPGRKYKFGWGTGSLKLAGPAVSDLGRIDAVVLIKLAGPAVSDLGRIEAVVLTHDHHDDNLDAPG